MKWGCLILIITIILDTIWRICYVCYLYPDHEVYEGIGDPDPRLGNYTHESKRQYVIIQIILNVCFVVIFIIGFMAAQVWEDIGEEEDEIID